MPRMKTLCISDEPGGYTGKAGRVEFQQLALLDQDDSQHGRLIQTFDYRMSPEEKAKYAGKCMGKTVVLDVRELEIFSSRLRIRAGSIVEVAGVK